MGDIGIDVGGNGLGKAVHVADRTFRADGTRNAAHHRHFGEQLRHREPVGRHRHSIIQSVIRLVAAGGELRIHIAGAGEQRGIHIKLVGHDTGILHIKRHHTERSHLFRNRDSLAARQLKLLYLTQIDFILHQFSTNIRIEEIG